VRFYHPDPRDSALFLTSLYRMLYGLPARVPLPTSRIIIGDSTPPCPLVPEKGQGASKLPNEVICFTEKGLDDLEETWTGYLNTLEVSIFARLLLSYHPELPVAISRLSNIIGNWNKL
jgi:hypothetical protein